MNVAMTFTTYDISSLLIVIDYKIVSSTRSNVPFKLCACAHTQVVRRAHTRKRGARISVPSKNIFAHISYTSFQIQTEFR